MSKRNVYLLNLSKHIEEMRLPTKGLFWQRRLDEIMGVVESLLFKGVYYASRWLNRGLQVRPAHLVLLVVLTALIIAIGVNL